MIRSLESSLLYCHIYLTATGMHCDRTMHVSADLSLWLDSPMFWAPWHQSISTNSQPCFCSSTWKRGGIWLCKLGVISQERFKIELKLLLSANRNNNMPRGLAQQRMALSDHFTYCALSLHQLSLLFVIFIKFVVDAAQNGQMAAFFCSV